MRRLGDFLDQYIDGRTDIKPSTRSNLEQVRRNLLEFFGADRPLDTIAARRCRRFPVVPLGAAGREHGAAELRTCQAILPRRGREAADTRESFRRYEGLRSEGQHEPAVLHHPRRGPRVLDCLPRCPMAVAVRSEPVRRAAVPVVRHLGATLGRRGLGTRPNHSPQPEDGTPRGRRISADSHVPRDAAVLGAGVGASRAGDGVGNHPLPKRQCQPADPIGADHPQGGFGAVAEAIPELRSTRETELAETYPFTSFAPGSATLRPWRPSTICR